MDIFKQMFRTKAVAVSIAALPFLLFMSCQPEELPDEPEPEPLNEASVKIDGLETTLTRDWGYMVAHDAGRLDISFSNENYTLYLKIPQTVEGNYNIVSYSNTFSLVTVAAIELNGEIYYSTSGVARIVEYLETEATIEFAILGTSQQGKTISASNGILRCTIETAPPDFTGFLNTPPYAPNTPNPANGATVSGPDITLSWNSSDKEGDAITYQVYFGSSEDDLSQMTTAAISATTYDLTGLSAGTYYWRIDASDATGTTSSNVFSFTVE